MVPCSLDAQHSRKSSEQRQAFLQTPADWMNSLSRHSPLVALGLTEDVVWSSVVQKLGRWSNETSNFIRILAKAPSPSSHRRGPRLPLVICPYPCGSYFLCGQPAVGRPLSPPQPRRRPSTARPPPSAHEPPRACQSPQPGRGRSGLAPSLPQAHLETGQYKSSLCLEAAQYKSRVSMDRLRLKSSGGKKKINARLHKMHAGESHLIGPHTFGNKNAHFNAESNINLLLEMCETLGLFVANTGFELSVEKQVTVYNVGSSPAATLNSTNFGQFDFLPVGWEMVVQNFDSRLMHGCVPGPTSLPTHCGDWRGFAKNDCYNISWPTVSLV